jgi:hypothetical protein
MVEATNISKEPGDRSELLIARDCFQPWAMRCRLLVPWARTVPAASAVDEAVVARFVPRSGCNVAGGPSDKPGYEAMLVRSIGTADRARHRPPRSHWLAAPSVTTPNSTALAKAASSRLRPAVAGT